MTNLKSITVSEKSQTQKDTHCKIPFWKRQNRKDRNQISGCLWLGWGVLVTIEQEENVGDVVNIFYILIIIVVTYLCLL